MMRYAFSALFLIAVFALVSPAFGNPPSAIHAAYNSDRQELDVNVQHIVTKTKEHFIKDVIVYKNGEEVARRHFDFQTSHRNQTTYPFKIAAVPGDTLKIVAICNIKGSGEKTLIVPPATAPSS